MEILNRKDHYVGNELPSLIFLFTFFNWKFTYYSRYANFLKIYNFIINFNDLFYYNSIWNLKKNIKYLYNINFYYPISNKIKFYTFFNLKSSKLNLIQNK